MQSDLHVLSKEKERWLYDREELDRQIKLYENLNDENKRLIYEK
jgi:hypothetical protein